VECATARDLQTFAFHCILAIGGDPLHPPPLPVSPHSTPLTPHVTPLPPQAWRWAHPTSPHSASVYGVLFRCWNSPSIGSDRPPETPQLDLPFVRLIVKENETLHLREMELRRPENHPELPKFYRRQELGS
jgi:hypothetical protein